MLPTLWLRREHTRIAKLEFRDFKPDNFGSRTLPWNTRQSAVPIRFSDSQICVREIAAADL